VSFLNDASEYDYASALIANELTLLEERLPLGTAYPLSDPNLRRITFDFLRRLATTRPYTAYAACSCEAKNLLSQWRAYGKNGTGYALEFQWKALEFQLKSFKDPSRPEVRTLSGRIEYDEAKQKGLVTQMLETHLKNYLQGPGQEAVSQPDWAARVDSAAWIRSAQAFIAVARAFLKSSDFSEEREWRIAVLSPREATEEFRPSDGLLKPYCEIPLGDPPPITRIVVGPGPYPEQAKSAVERYLRKLNLEHIPVEGSTTPVRFWPAS
jgi:hypothetical protein